MSRGILYVAFGKECLRLASYTIAHSRQFTNLPICILTNVRVRGERWKNISNISFIYINDTLENNRSYKTQMNKYTPFDKTLYLDCDSVIQNIGIENIFIGLKDSDIVCNRFLEWNIGEKVLLLYRKAMKVAGVKLPLNVYNGALICFKKNNKVNRFFLKWNLFWKSTGSGREMPALACALNLSEIEIGCLEKNIFSPDYYNPESIVQHNYNVEKYNVNFFDRFNIPKIKLSKKFDKNPKDWNWVEF